MAENKSSITDVRDTAQAVDAWFNLSWKLAVFILLFMLVFLPHEVPIFNRFVIKVTKINILGQEIQIADTALLGKGIEITNDGKLLVSGVDVNDISDNNAKLKQTIKDLDNKNIDLSSNILVANALLADTKAQLDEANRRLASKSTDSEPVAAQALARRITSLGNDIGAQLNASVLLSAQASQVLRENTALPAVGFGIVFGGDKTPEAAMDEVKRTTQIAGFSNPVILYKRQGFWRAVAYYGSRGTANSQLTLFKTIWPEAYQVDIATWCPSPTRLSAEKPGVMSELKDCNF